MIKWQLSINIAAMKVLDIPFYSYRVKHIVKCEKQHVVSELVNTEQVKIAVVISVEQALMIVGKLMK